MKLKTYRLRDYHLVVFANVPGNFLKEILPDVFFAEVIIVGVAHEVLPTVLETGYKVLL